MTNIELAWLSGFTDGEGCIGVNLDKSKAMKNPSWASYSCVLRIANTDLSVLYYIQKITGMGTISKINRRDSIGKNWKPVYKWSIYANGMRKLLPELLPYLKIKKKQAKLAIEILNIKRGRGYGSNLTQQQKIRRTEILNEMKILNKRGLSDNNINDRRTFIHCSL